MKASILAVGTELTTGQIANKNAAWISEKLKSFGVQVVMHLTVPDDRKVILESLQYLETNSDLIFVTGGLGPTSDDFTRDIITAWADKKMVFDNDSWDQILERFKSRGFTVRDIQRQQCYFPETDRILKNSQGTANGFSLELIKKSQIKNVFVLPGPPSEIAAIWKDHIHSWLLENTKNLDKTITKSWDTLGVGESDVADRIEKVFQDFSTLRTVVEIGYRVHLPYVEVKLSFLESAHGEVKKLLNHIDQALVEITATKDFQDVAQTFFDPLKNIEFTFYDYVTDGFLHSRLAPHLRNQKRWNWQQTETAPPIDFFEGEENFLALIPLKEDQIVVISDFQGQKKQWTIEAPMKSALMLERRKQYFAEMALLKSSQLIKN